MNPPETSGLYVVDIPEEDIWYAYFNAKSGRWGWAYPNKSWAMQKEWREHRDAQQNKVWVRKTK